MIHIKEVLTKKDLKTWVRFPTKLYGKNPYYVPFLENDEIDTFSKDKNPAFAFCESRQFLAYRDGKVVGRIAGIINHAYNQKWDKNAIRFTRFDFIDDYEVSSALFGAVVSWGKERGHTEIMGPIGFTDMDHEGMLVEGFDKLSMSITFYNHPYYLTHMERLGLQKDIDWFEYKLFVPDEISPRIQRMTDHILRKDHYDIVTYTDRKVLYKEAFEAFHIIDIAFSKLYGTVPLTPEIIKNAIDSYIAFMELDFVCSIKDKEGKIVGFGAMLPSLAKAQKKSNGKLFPFGIFRMLKALKCKNDTVEMYFIAVAPEHQLQGVPMLVIHTLLSQLIRHKVKYCETGPMLETNGAVHSMWSFFDKEQHKRRRCYIKSI